MYIRSKMLSLSEVKLLETLVAEESDEELEEILLDHYDAKEEHLKEEASLRLRSRFEFESCSVERFRELFRFEKQDVERLRMALGIPNHMTAPNRSSWSGLEGLLILLRMLAYPTRRRDVERLFGRGRSTISVIFNTMLNLIYDRFSPLLLDLSANAWLTRDILYEACTVVGARCPLQNVWGFIDGTVRRSARPVEGQRLFYSGHKRCHALKFQSITTPFGIIAHLFGPVEGRCHDAALLAESRWSRT